MVALDAGIDSFLPAGLAMDALENSV